MTPAQLKASLEDTSRNWAARAELTAAALAMLQRSRMRRRRTVEALLILLGMGIGGAALVLFILWGEK